MHTTPPLDYASQHADADSYRVRVRRVVAILALAYGTSNLLSDVVSQLQYLNLLRGVPGFTFDPNRLTDWIEVVPSWTSHLGLIVAGVMLLAGARHGVTMLRIAACCGVAFHLAVFIMQITGVLWFGTVYPANHVTLFLSAWIHGAFVLTLAILPLSSRRH